MKQTRTRKTARSLLVWLLLFTMVFGLLPMAAFADEAESGVVDVGAPEATEKPVATEQPEEPQQPEEPETTEQPADADADEADESDEADTQAEDGVISEDDILNLSVSNLPTTANGSIRAVMLDCGRKYFSVDEIKNLIDAMVKYKYNQLQLSFGNGGCRFLLDDMSLKFKDSNGNTVTMDSDTVKAQISAGNNNFNGDSSYLTQSDMDAIIAYASGKVSIVPMLNMPGHATAIVYDTAYSSGGNLNVNDLAARNYGYALLSKYVDYFKGKCQYFSFGSDESGFTGDNMTSFVTGCANIIANAGMRPRAFNDATNVATYPTYVQISYWHQENGSKTASALANAGYEMLNTHGRWYYVIKTAQNSEQGTKYWQGTVNSAATSVELPVMKAEKMDQRWVSLNEYFDANPGYGSTISNSKGTMFCIWCDASKNDYLTGAQVLSYNENYGALYQLQKLAEHYWGDELVESPEPTATPEPTPSATPAPTDKTEYVELKVGESKTFDTTAATGDYETGDAYIATAKAESTAATTKHLEKVASADNFAAGKEYLLVNNRYEKATSNVVLTNTSTKEWNTGADYYGLKLNGATSENSAHWWSIEPANGGYYIRYNGSNYLSAGNNTATLSSTVSIMTLAYNATDGYWNISQNGYYLNNLGETAQVGGWQHTNAPTDGGSKWTIYEVVEAKEATGTLTITGTGEGTTKATIGGVEYTINVTAPNTAENVALSYGSTYTLPANVEATVKSGEEYITLANGVITAGQTDGTAVIEAVVKNAGGKVIERRTYNVVVSKIDFENIEPLTVQLWITNTWVGADEAPTSLQTVAIKAEDAYSEDGILLSSKVPTTGYKKDGEKTVQVTYWKGTALHDGIVPVQQGADYSSGNDDFVRIRYWNNNWQYLLNNEWVSIDQSKDKDTIIAYYLQKNNVSPEITTGAQHYGNPPTSYPGYTSGNGYTMTAFAVVYPDGTLSRTEPEMYKTSIIRGYWGGDKNNIGVIYAENNSDYVVSKMTLTWGENVKGANDGGAWYVGTNTDDTYGNTWGVKWDKKTNSAGNEWYDETTYWTKGKSDIPMIDGNAEGIEFTTASVDENDPAKSNGKNAALILIYLEAVEKDDNLNVVYWDDNGNKQINTAPIQIVVKDGVTFLNGLKNGQGEVIGETKSWPSKDKTNTTEYLPDDAYITNKSNSNQRINKDVSSIPNVAGVYVSGLYEYVSADISDDGKTLTLHYNVKKSVNTTKTYVVDFGLPLEISASDFGIENTQTIDWVSLEAGSKSKTDAVKKKMGNYGEATIADDWSKVTYVLKETIDSMATMPLYVMFNGESATKLFTVNIIPASNVYYEDSFATFVGGKNTASAAQWSVEKDDPNATTDITPNQALEQLGGEENNVYGYDPAYADSTKFSMGSAHTVNVTSDMLNGWNGDSAWPTASFTFKGTGFDVISLTDNRSGAIIVRVHKGNSTNGELVASYIVDNYYGYTQDADGKWVVDTDSTDCLYQIPVMQVRNLGYGEYTAEIVVFYNNAFDHTKGNTSYSFWLDAIRVYNPLGENYSDYTKDGEGYPQYIKLHDYVVTNKDNLKDKVLFIDGADEANVAAYENFGPNNEVYLAKGQAISFKLSGNLDKIAEVQIGAKAPNGETNLNVNGADTVANLNTATEMYYDITAAAKTGSTVTVTNNGSNILSLTSIKVTFAESASVELAVPSETDKSEAVALVRALFAAPVVEPDPFEPSRFEAKWSDNVRQGGRAVLTVKTSEDVEQIVINGNVVVDSYRTRTERSGWGWNAKRVTYREFTYMITAQEGAEYSVTAVNAEGDESEAITATLTVKPARPSWGWFDSLFGRWF